MSEQSIADCSLFFCPLCLAGYSVLIDEIGALYHLRYKSCDARENGCFFLYRTEAGCNATKKSGVSSILTHRLVYNRNKCCFCAISSPLRCV